MNPADEIRRRVTMPDILTAYGIETSGKHRIPCPLHHGKDRNFSYTDKLFHCFVCGAGGDVIRFVMDYFDIRFTSAVTRIDEDFRLGLFSFPNRRNQPPVSRRSDDYAKAKRLYYAQYNAVSKERREDYHIMLKCRPAQQEEPASFVFHTALHKVCELDGWLDAFADFKAWANHYLGWEAEHCTP